MVQAARAFLKPHPTVLVQPGTGGSGFPGLPCPAEDVQTRRELWIVSMDIFAIHYSEDLDMYSPVLSLRLSP